MTSGHDWGGGPDLSAWETVMWRLENDPRTRATALIVELLDTEPEWSRFLDSHERGSRKLPRLRERIVEPSLPVGLPAWSEDEHFDIEHHVYRVRLPEPGNQAQLQEALEGIMHRPLDRSRPPWEVVLVTGLEGGRAAYALKTHHALSDGMGLIHLMEVGHSRTRQPGPRQVPTAPDRPRFTPATLTAQRMREHVTSTPAQAVRRAADAGRYVGRGSLRMDTSLPSAMAWLKAVRRSMQPLPVRRSRLLRGGGATGCRILLYDVPLAGLRDAGKAAGGTLNDAYVTAILGAMREYHERHGVTGIDQLPITMPIGTRRHGDPAAGNHLTATRMALPMAERDPAVRLREVRAAVLTARQDPALGLVEHLAPAALLLPETTVANAIAARTGGTDLQISNLSGVRHETFIAGAKVIRTYPVGPRPAVAAMVAMMSYEDTACIAFNLDAEVFTDPDVLRECLDVGFGEVLAMGEASAGTAAPSMTGGSTATSEPVQTA